MNKENCKQNNISNRKYIHVKVKKYKNYLRGDLVFLNRENVSFLFVLIRNNNNIILL